MTHRVRYIILSITLQDDRQRVGYFAGLENNDRVDFRMISPCLGYEAAVKHILHYTLESEERIGKLWIAPIPSKDVSI